MSATPGMSPPTEKKGTPGPRKNANPLIAGNIVSIGDIKVSRQRQTSVRYKAIIEKALTLKQGQAFEVPIDKDWNSKAQSNNIRLKLSRVAHKVEGSFIVRLTDNGTIMVGLGPKSDKKRPGRPKKNQVVNPVAAPK